MAEFRFFNIDDGQISNKTWVPAGRHLCEVTKAEDMAESRSPHFRLQLSVVEGEHEGLICCYDRLYYASERALPRVKFVLRSLGIDVDHKDTLEIEPEELVSRRAFVTTEDDWSCPECGWSVHPTSRVGDRGRIFTCEKDSCFWEGVGEETKQYTRPKYDGYEEASPEKSQADADDGGIPF